MTKSVAKLSLLLLLLSVQLGFAQRSEVGFGVGTLNYTGDLVRNYNFAYSKPAATVFYRSNLNKALSFKASLVAGKIGANDSRPIDAFAGTRQASFDLFLFEAATTFEYHFLDWRDSKRMIRFTPYLFGGLGLFGISGAQNKNAEYSNVQGIIPFGVGFKYVLNPKWYVAIEIGARKTTFDYLDNISGGDLTNKNYQYGNPLDNDTYYFLGITLTRTFYTIPCPTNPYK
jgi:hypothetical protein